MGDADTANLFHVTDKLFGYIDRLKTAAEGFIKKTFNMFLKEVF